jgi:hypothetical protein
MSFFFRTSEGSGNNLAIAEIVIRFLSCLPRGYLIPSLVLYFCLILLFACIFLNFSIRFSLLLPRTISTALLRSDVCMVISRPCLLLGQAQQPSLQPVYHSELLGVPQNLLNNRTCVNAYKRNGRSKRQTHSFGSLFNMVWLCSSHA